MPVICLDCDTENAGDALFCSTCGAPLVAIAPPPNAPAPPADTVYYECGGVRISRSRAALGARTFAMDEVQSVSLGKRSGLQVAYVALVVASGVVMGASLIGLVLTPLQPLRYLVLLGAAGVWFGRVAVSKARPEYLVRLGRASGEVEALASTDREHVEAAVRAIEQALADQQAEE